jgi:hypothetical protein
MNMELRGNTVTVDISFANGLSKARNNWIFQIFFHILQFATMAIMIPL